MITLAQAIPLEKVIRRRIGELMLERHNVATATVVKGEEPEPLSRTVEMITSEIEKAQADLCRLTEMIAIANLNHTVEWNKEKISLTRALEMARQMRSELQQLKNLASKKKVQRVTGRFTGETDLLQVTTYDPEEYRLKALKLERQVEKLSGDIEHQNHFVEIPFDASDYLA